MDSVDDIRNELIDKILSITDREVLEDLIRLVTSSALLPGETELSSAQREILEMSEEDIKNGNLISQEAMDKRNLEWLNGR
jgi:hypothetical protein